MKKVNWGIIGLGSIAIKFADGFKNSENAKLIAISSKNSNKLKKFKEQFKINDFIEAKDRLIKRDFPGISYIECPPDTDCIIDCGD